MLLLNVFKISNSDIGSPPLLTGALGQITLKISLLIIFKQALEFSAIKLLATSFGEKGTIGFFKKHTLLLIALPKKLNISLDVGVCLLIGTPENVFDNPPSLHGRQTNFLCIYLIFSPLCFLVNSFFSPVFLFWVA